MSILFPIAHPTLPGFKRLTMKMSNVVGVSVSPFTKVRQVQDWGADLWSAGVTLPPMGVDATGIANASAWEAFFLSCRGQGGSFMLGDPTRSTPRGTAPGTPFVKGTQTAGSKTLVTRGWTPSIAGILKQGDNLQTCKNQLLSPSAFNAADWTKTQATSSTDSIVAPDGATTAERLTPTGGATDVIVKQAVTLSNIVGRVFTGYVWLKLAAGTASVNIYAYDNIGSTSAVCALTTTWTLFTVSRTIAAGATSIGFQIGGATTWVAATGAIDAWGASLYSLTYDGRLYKILNDANSDANGEVTLDISPVVRSNSVFDVSRIITASPKGEFALANNEVQWDTDEAKIKSFAFEAVEAL